MTGRNHFDRDLGAYLQARATGRAPDGLLDAALGQIGATSQRPGWLIPDRWFAPRTKVRLTWVIRGVARVALVALLIAITLATIVIVGSRPRLPSPFGLARPGLVAYTSLDHLYVVNVDGSGRRQLTFGPNVDFRPTWSPDGTLIAYWSYGAGGYALKVVRPDGQGDVTIADRLEPTLMDSISWAPDSRHLTFAGVALDAPDSASHIYVAQADRPGASEIGEPALEGFEPILSPDGKRIAFKNRDPAEALWLTDADGSNAHRLTTAPGSGYAFENTQWSPDGKRLLFLAGQDGAHDVRVINSDGTGERNISNSPEDESWPTWSPDGSKVAFVRMKAAGYGASSTAVSGASGAIVVVAPDGSHPITLSGPAVDRDPPIWSPDATKLFGYEARPGLGLWTSLPALGGHKQIIIYDPLDRMRPMIVAGGDEGSWQRLAN
jgi:TolB protein